MKSSPNSVSVLPFKLETRLEQNIVAVPEWLEGVVWGKPRPGHPEGKVVSHIRDVLNNIDRFFSNSSDRSRLRLVALIHDPFKYKENRTETEARKRSHGYLAWDFAERYINDKGVLKVIELHDEAYKAWQLLAQPGKQAVAEQRATELMTQLDYHLDLFMRFYLCDHRTGDKSVTHYEWFKKVMEKWEVYR